MKQYILNTNKIVLGKLLDAYSTPQYNYKCKPISNITRHPNISEDIFPLLELASELKTNVCTEVIIAIPRCERYGNYHIRAVDCCWYGKIWYKI